MSASIGIDIGGTKIAGAVVAADGTILARDRRESPAEDTEALVATIAEQVRALTEAARSEPVAVGVACAGFIDRAGEVVRFAPNMAWRDEPLKARLEAGTPLPVHLENDANAAAWGEFRFGAGRDAGSMVLLTLGTGVGGGIIMEGELLRGAHGVGAELGHVQMVRDGYPCGCGNLGCLESYASGTALLRAARDLMRSGSPLGQGLLDRCGGDPEALKGRQVDEAAAEGDPGAVRLLADLGRWAGQGAASICAVLDPELVVIGGGVSHAGDLVVAPAREALQSSVRLGNRPVPDLVAATLGNDAGAIGAADLARARYAASR